MFPGFGSLSAAIRNFNSSTNRLNCSLGDLVPVRLQETAPLADVLRGDVFNPARRKFSRIAARLTCRFTGYRPGPRHWTKLGRDPTPSGACLDSQSTKTA